MRIVVVDDRADVAARRVSWLAEYPGAKAQAMSFVQALGAEWTDVDVVVLDGRDDRVSATVTLPAQEATVESYDRFLGPRVAQTIRRTRTPQQTRIVLVSAYARENDLLARRCFETGVDYVYDVQELNDSEQFLAAVLTPAPPAVSRTTQERSARRRQSLTAAIEAVEESPAGRQLLFDEPASDHPGMAHHLRVLRERVGELLAVRSASRGGARERHPSKRQLSALLRRALGLRR